MNIPPIRRQDPGLAPFSEAASIQRDERLTSVVANALQTAWKVSPGKSLKVEGYARRLFEEATHSLMQEISSLLRERAPGESKGPNLACEELGRIASQKAAEESLLLHGFFAEQGNSKAQQGLIKLLLVADLVGELGLQLDEQKFGKIDNAFEWAVAAAEGKEGTSPDLKVLNDAIQVGEESLVDLLSKGYPLASKA